MTGRLLSFMFIMGIDKKSPQMTTKNEQLKIWTKEMATNKEMI